MIYNACFLIAFLSFLCFFFLKTKKKDKKNNLYLLGWSAGLSWGVWILWCLFDCPTTFFSIQWFFSSLQPFSLSFLFDSATGSFFPVGLFVTWSIVEFSHYYMADDPNKKSFIKTLVLFLLFMLILVSSNSLFLLFIGWEGVGILSFILIGWWFTRRDANSAAIQAIIYNRIGDSGIILFLALAITFYNSWDLKEILWISTTSPFSFFLIAGIVVAAVGKSAQFILHPWLPAAMEGPTPVSALLHSSTMVVAGVFLLFRTFPLYSKKLTALGLIGIIGSVTAIFAARAALCQYDMKKVVAYSTTSQLGLMVAAIGLGLPYLALFHICTHAFFKALLFLCSGSAIHSYKNEQDIRKISATQWGTPLTLSAIILGNLALSGIPFLAGFYSKDLILEACQAKITKRICTILALIATFFTALYSFRVIYYIALNTPHTPLKPIREKNKNLQKAILRLLLGAIVAGWGLTLSFFNFSPFLIPLIKKNFPFFISIIAIRTAFRIIILLPGTTAFLAKNWYYTQITHTNTFRASLQRRLKGTLRRLDHGWTSQLGVKALSSLFPPLTKRIQRALTGTTTHYLIYAFILSSPLTIIFLTYGL